jgi:hypothetical protein
MTDLRHASPYDQGVAAGRRGGTPTNPYDGRTKEGRQWKEGYRAGLQHSRMDPRVVRAGDILDGKEGRYD